MMPTVADYRTSNLLILRVPATERVPVTAEVASSSLVVPAISSKRTRLAFPVQAEFSPRIISLVQLDQGLTTGTERSSKCDVFRVASFACEASTMPAIIVSRNSPGRPSL